MGFICKQKNTALELADENEWKNSTSWHESRWNMRPVGQISWLCFWFFLPFVCVLCHLVQVELKALLLLWERESWGATSHLSISIVSEIWVNSTPSNSIESTQWMNMYTFCCNDENSLHSSLCCHRAKES